MFWGLKSPCTATACFISPTMSSSLGCSPSVANSHSVLEICLGLKSPRTSTDRAVSPASSALLGCSPIFANTHSVV